MFLDLSKAFDTENHSILYKKLNHCEIRGLPLEWIKIYFSQTFQFVNFDGYRYTHRNIYCGVPQSWFLAPLFFILYINDLLKISQFESILFANHTNLFISNKDPANLHKILKDELNKLSVWLAANKLSLNVANTKFMVFIQKEIDVLWFPTFHQWESNSSSLRNSLSWCYSRWTSFLESP